MRKGGFTALVAIALFSASCDDPFVVHEGDFSVRAETGAFVIRNGSNALESVQILVEQEFAALFDPAPCNQWSDPLAAGSERSIPHGDVVGFNAAADSVIVLWCLLGNGEPADGGSITLPFR